MGAYEHYLSHHGILGQKWGVRRFQNEDGSLTAEGKARYLKEETFGKNKVKGYLLTDEGEKEFLDKNGNLTKAGRKIVEEYPDSDEAKAIKIIAADRKYSKNWLKSYNEAADAINAKLPEINKKYENVDLDDDKNNLKYTMEVAAAWQEAYGNILARDFGEHPYIGREWMHNALAYDQFNGDIEDLQRKVNGKT